MTDTLRSICEQCTHLNNPQIDFFPAKFSRHNEIILRDLRELFAVASNEHKKACVILSGSVLEAILYTFILWQKPQIVARRGSFKLQGDESLQNYLEIFNRWFGREFPKLQLSRQLVEYRDLVHITNELGSPREVCGKAARTLLRTLDALIGELGTYGRVVP